MSSRNLIEHFQQMVEEENRTHTFSVFNLRRCRSDWWKRRWNKCWIFAGISVFTIATIFLFARVHRPKINIEVGAKHQNETIAIISVNTKNNDNAINVGHLQPEKNFTILPGLETETSTTLPESFENEDVTIPDDFKNELNSTIPGDFENGDNSTISGNFQHENDVDLIRNSTALMSPCDNFYNFACQKWPKEIPRPDKPRTFPIYTAIKAITKDIMEEPVQEDDISAVKKAHAYYKKCLETQTTFTVGQEFDCVAEMSSIFYLVIWHKYLKILYNSTENFNENFAQVKIMGAHIREHILELIGAISKRTFYPNETRNLELCFDVPTWIFNETRVDEEYRDLNLKNGNTFSNELDAAHNWQRARKWPGDNKMCKMADFFQSSHDRTNRKIHINMHQLQYSQAVSYRPSMMYGNVGFRIATEDLYLLVDNPNADWYARKNDSLADVDKCLIDQYNSFTSAGLHEKSIYRYYHQEILTTYSENVGLQAAYFANKQATKLVPYKIIKSREMIGLEEYNDNQLFFLHMHRACSSLTLKQTKWDAKSDRSYSLFMLTSLQNFPDFADAWGCPVGSRMNPHKKCLLFQ